MRPGRLLCIVTITFAAASLAWSQEAKAQVRIWTGDVMAPFRDFDFDAGGKQAIEPVRIVGARNGTFSGKVVLGSTAPIKDVEATITDFKSDGASIPASAARIAYPPYDGRGAWLVTPKAISMYDDLVAKQVESPLVTRNPDAKRIDFIPLNHAFQPVWITVKVPKDAKPGDYAAELTVKVEGAGPFKAPVQLKVHDWALPDPGDYATFVELIQSPDSLAIQYDVPLWSERHFELMGDSLALMSDIGSRSVYIPLICETNMGNAESMVRWTERADGTSDHDFSIMDRYLDLVEKRFGRPRIVGLIVWDIFLEGGPGGKKEVDAPKNVEDVPGNDKPQVTTIVDGKAQKLTLPSYTDPRSPTLWKPMLDELRARLKKRGLEDAMMVGIATDYVPAKEVVEHFARLLPGVPWVHHSHSFYGGRDRKIAAGGTFVGYASHVWCRRQRIDPSKQRWYGWKAEDEKDDALIATHYHRGLRENSEIATYRLLGEMNLAGNKAGFGRMGADFWHVVKDQRGRLVGRVSDGRYPRSMWRNLDIRVAMLAAGPEGSLPTARYEMMREGVEECEARIFIEKALLDETQRSKLGQALADECQSLLDDRTGTIVRAFLTPGKDGKKGQGDSVSIEGYDDYMKWNWQQHSDALYAAAGKVAAKLGER